MSLEQDLIIPREFDRYRLERALGKGGMGEVWLCEDTLLERLVAIKFISARDPTAESRRRFLVEARAIARLSHPCVVTIHRVGEVASRPYIVYEFVEGASLDALPLPLPWRRVLDIGHDLARGLAMAHRAGVIHRDIKPANAILSKEGTVKLLDFGIARLLGAAPTADSGVAPAHQPVEKPCAPQAAGLAATARALPRPLGLAEEPAPAPLGATAQAIPRGRPREILAPLPMASDERVNHAVSHELEAASLAFAADGGRLTLPGSVLGTPLYMAPEMWRGEPATFAADVYSLGAVLFVLATGQPPHGGRTLEELQASVLTCDAQPLASVLPEVDRQFAAIIDRCLHRSSADRYEGAAEVRTALAQVLRSLRGEVVPEGNPYRGLRAFEASHRAVFFGRESEVAALLERMASDPLVLVAGDSGVGKSSLCRAGVLPRVGDWLDAARSWSVVTLCPGPHPQSALCAAIANHFGRPEPAIAESMAEGATAFGRELRRLSGADRGLVLFIDQLEELVTLASAAEGGAIAELLTGLAVATPGLKLLASVRGDFLGRVSALPGLGDVLQRSLYFLRPLSRERLREVITGPAQRAGITFESEAFVDTLVDSTASAAGGLPLLQFTLSRLFDARDVENHRIPMAALDALGGVAGALSLHADEVLGRLEPADRDLARSILLRLVTADGTRARRPWRELIEVFPAAEPTLNALVQGRILAVIETPEGAACELAHEALLRGWGTLSRWLALDAGAQVVRERLAAARAEWLRLGKSGNALWRAEQLAEAQALDLNELPAEDLAFLTDSRRAERRSTWKRAAWVVAAVAAVVGTWAGVHGYNRLLLTRRVDHQIAAAARERQTAERAGALAESLETKALASFDNRDKDQGEAAWQKARQARTEQGEAWSRAAQELEPAAKLDPDRQDVRNAFADALYARACLADQRHESSSRDELLRRLQLYDEDGSRQRAYSASGLVLLAVDPPGATVRLERYQLNPQQQWLVGPVPTVQPWPSAGLPLPPGSYRLTVEAPGRVTALLPFAVSRGQKVELKVAPPPAATVPADFAYVGAGIFYFGSAEEDSLRRGFLHTVPIHPVAERAYLIARHETTFADYLTFLSALEPELRLFRSPSIHTGGFEGALTLNSQPDGQWQLTFKPTTRAYTVRSGELLAYAGRRQEIKQNWLKMPVVGVSAADAEAYAAWLAASGRVPGARLCTEREWERAARGGDMRAYPHAEVLQPQEANFDESYAKEPTAMGPDEVGSHPQSRSPLGLDDMAGNVFEWTRSSLEPSGHAARGGSFYFDRNSARVAARETPEPSFRDVSVGLRVCADVAPR